MNGKELFNKIYDNKIKEDECIQVLHPKEENHYLMRNNNGEFDKNELIRCLLFKDYTFEIVNQEDATKTLDEMAKQEEIKRLEERLKELKGKNKKIKEGEIDE